MLERLWRAVVMIVLWRRGALRRLRRGRHAEAKRGRTKRGEAKRGGAKRDGAETQGAQEQDAMLEREVGAPLWAERLVAILLALVALPALGFVALFVLDPDTQLLGLAAALALALLSAALAIASNNLVPQETKSEPRPSLHDPQQVEGAAHEIAAGFEGITRRRMLLGAAGLAGAGLTAAAAIPVVGLGPGLEDQLSRTPWHSGRAVVDDEGDPIAAVDIVERSFVTGFPEGANKEDLGAPIVIVRVDPATLALPPERSGWAPEGLIAYSKICTHAACAISLYRAPLSPSTQSRPPALVCPCHYSTFDVLNGGKVEWGPAGRPLPQLPLTIDAHGNLRANGPMSGPVGPAWFGDRE